MGTGHNAVRRATGSLTARPNGLPDIGAKLIVPILAFGVAFGLDVVTDRRWSSVWGSLALVASVATFPWVRRLVLPVAAYTAVWVGFNALRAVADNIGLGVVRRTDVAKLESWLLGGELPSAVAQRTVLDPDRIGAAHVVLTAVYLSFFIVPHVVAGLLLWRCRALARRFLVAIVILFAIGIAGFLALPTNPPWLASEIDDGATFGAVVRLPDRTLSAGGISLATGAGDDQDYAFDPNPVASMPSIHLGVTAVIAAVAWGARGLWHWAGLGYVALMALALVASGEHYVVDVFAGGVAAVAAWWISGAAGFGRQRSFGLRTTPVAATLSRASNRTPI